ncbi:MAG: hypothetical protein U1E26_11040 [Coriobacteriia bacterium]|nr:hypothetical protein [Coriobacteriia bacterium]
MTALNAKTDSFIALLLDVSGRARPTDLQGMAPAEASEALQQFAAVHPELALAFDGDSLGPARTATPAAPAAPAPPAGDDGMFEFGPAATPAAIEPTSAPAQAVAVPGSDESASWPAVDSAPSSDDFLDLPPLEGVGDAADIAPRVPLYWWLLAVLFGWLGGLVGWLVLKKRNPKGARTVLIVGIATTVLAVVVGVAGFALGFASLLGMAAVEPVPVAPVPISAPSTAGAEATSGAEATAAP